MDLDEIKLTQSISVPIWCLGLLYFIYIQYFTQLIHMISSSFIIFFID